MKKMEQLEQLLTKGEFLKSDRSGYQEKCKHFFSSSMGRSLKILDFTCAHDFVLMQMCIDNVSHTGVLAYMIVEEFKNVK